MGRLVAAGRLTLRAASPGKAPERRDVEPDPDLDAPARGSEIDANGVPNVLVVMLLTPFT